jgi:excisionase family DNA binding protein
MLTTVEAAELLGVGQSTLNKWAVDGKVPRTMAWKGDIRVALYRRSDIETLKEQRGGPLVKEDGEFLSQNQAYIKAAEVGVTSNEVKAAMNAGVLPSEEFKGRGPHKNYRIPTEAFRTWLVVVAQNVPPQENGSRPPPAKPRAPRYGSVEDILTELNVQREVLRNVEDNLTVVARELRFVMDRQVKAERKQMRDQARRLWEGMEK